MPGCFCSWLKICSYVLYKLNIFVFGCARYTYIYIGLKILDIISEKGDLPNMAGTAVGLVLAGVLLLLVGDGVRHGGEDAEQAGVLLVDGIHV
jgi:hypothetical protein